jgi:hypothetical protein
MQRFEQQLCASGRDVMELTGSLNMGYGSD